MLDPGVLLVGVLLRVLVGGVGRDPVGNVLGDEAVDAVRVGPGDVAELVVEGLEDVGQPVEFRLGLVAAAAGRHGADLGVLVGQLHLHRRLLLDAVAVHVDGFEDALRQVFFLGGGQLGDQEIQEDRELLPSGVRVGQDRREEAVGAGERLGLAFEIDLAVLVELLVVGGDAGVEDRVEPVAVGAAQIQLDQLVDLGWSNRPGSRRARLSGRAACSGRFPRSGSWCGSSPRTPPGSCPRRS